MEHGGVERGVRESFQKNFSAKKWDICTSQKSSGFDRTRPSQPRQSRWTGWRGRTLPTVAYWQQPGPGSSAALMRAGIMAATVRSPAEGAR